MRQPRRFARHHETWTSFFILALLALLIPCPSAAPLLRRSRNSRGSLLDTTAQGASSHKHSSERLEVLPAVVQGESLVPDFSKSQWTWVTGNAQVSGLVAPAAAPSPAESAAPAPGPVQASNPCDELRKAGEAAFPGQFLDCKEFRYYGSSVFAQSDPYGCHCSSWSVNCPFETCRVSTAWEDQCLDQKVMGMGFTGLSKMSNYLPPTSIPKALRSSGSHPDYISMCMYWRSKPPTLALPPTNVASYGLSLPSFATLRFDGVDVQGCMTFVDTEMNIGQAKAALLTALGAQDLEIISITCGSDLDNHGADVLIEGPPNSVAQAVGKQHGSAFCFQALGIQACTSLRGPAPAPAPGPAAAR